MLFNIWLSWDDARGCPVNVTEVEIATHYYVTTVSNIMIIL